MIQSGKVFAKLDVKNENEDVILVYYSTLHIYVTDSEEVQQTSEREPSPLWERNRCVESATKGGEIFKAHEHHLTGKTPTHDRAEKALRSSPAC